MASSEPRYDALVRHMQGWVWQRCPGCGRKSKYHPEGGSHGDFHSDGCPLEGLYGNTHQWWFERELERLSALLVQACDIAWAKGDEAHNNDRAFEEQVGRPIAEIRRQAGIEPLRGLSQEGSG